MKTFSQFAADTLSTLNDATATRAAYERYLAKGNLPIAFELFALAYGEKKREAKTTDQLRAEYEQECEDMKRDLDPIEAEFGGVPTYREWLAEHTDFAEIPYA